jgi:hypothetical protein
MSNVKPRVKSAGLEAEPVLSVSTKWGALALGVRVALIGVPLALVVLIVVVSPTLGLVAAVLVVGMALATVLYAKNRSDRLNAIRREDQDN